jgi:hypothetical protein
MSPPNPTGGLAGRAIFIVLHLHSNRVRLGSGIHTARSDSDAISDSDDVTLPATLYSYMFDYSLRHLIDYII